MVKHRIDVYLSTQSLMYIERLKQEWKRKNYSQTVDHMIQNYIHLLEKTITKRESDAKKEKVNLTKKFGLDEYAYNR